MTSQINPNNIDGNYPVAGQPNNTQGFRDNFTNTKTNLQYAASEITDLQNKAVLKEALAGTTLNNNMNDGLIYAVKLQDVSYTYMQNVATTGPVTIDYTNGQYQYITTTGSISLSFTNWPISGTAGSVDVAINITNTAYTVTLPAAVTLGTTGVQGLSGSVITFAATGTYQFRFFTVDSGTTITLFDLNRPLSSFTNAVSITAATAATSTTTGALKVTGGIGTGGNIFAGGLISATGNIKGGNIITAGDASITGNLVVSGNASLSGNIVADAVVNGTTNISIPVASGNANVTIGGTSNVVVWTTTGQLVTGLISATGNVNGGNVISADLVQGVTLSASGNVIGGNINTGGSVSATGNVSLSGKLSGRIDPRVSSTASASSVTPDVSLYDQYCFTALAAGLTINAPIGTPVDGNKLLFRILDNGTSRALTWNGTFTAIGVTIPVATTISKTTYVGCIYNAANTRWDVISVTTQV